MEYTLSPHCKISEIREEEYKKKKQYVFRITWPTAAEEEDEDVEDEEDEPGLRVLESPRPSSGVTTHSPNSAASTAEAAAFLDTPTGSEGGSTPSTTLRRAKTTGGIRTIDAAAGVAPALSAPGSRLSKGKSDDSSLSTKVAKSAKKATWWGGFFGSGNGSADSGSSNSPLDLACDTRTDAATWVDALTDSLHRLSVANSGEGMSHSRRAAPPGVRIKEVEEWLKSSRWKVCSILDGVRIFEQAGYDETAVRGSSGVRVETAETEPVADQRPRNPYADIPCYRVNIGVCSGTLDVFKSIMSLPPGCRTGAIKQMRVIESIDNYTDIVHILLDPIYIYPTWTAPRDLCLMRYWKHLADKSYVICFDSTDHRDCPLTTGYVRADMHATYLISPPKGADYDEEQEECLITYIAQMDPRGWVWRAFGFQHAMLQIFMLHVLDIRDSLDMDRFVKVTFDPSHERRLSMALSLSAKTLVTLAEAGTSSLGSIPPPALPPHMWAEPDLQTFRLRGKTYNQDKQKVRVFVVVFPLFVDPSEFASMHER